MHESKQVLYWKNCSPFFVVKNVAVFQQEKIIQSSFLLEVKWTNYKYISLETYTNVRHFNIKLY